MIELFLALLLATCERGEAIPDWYEYTRTHVLHDLSASIRFQNKDGVRWLYVFDNRVLFLTGLDTEHGTCARELP